LTRVDARHIAVGYGNGGIELVRAKAPAKSKASPALSFHKTSSSPVVRMMVGPMSTLIVGFANGVVGTWSLRDGRLLAERKLHGPIEHMLLEDQTLYVASALGQHLRWDFSTLYADRCAVLRELWRRVPIIWRDGRAVVTEPPSKHECRQTGTSAP
jgi:hypothetical protein